MSFVWIASRCAARDPVERALELAREQGQFLILVLEEEETVGPASAGWHEEALRQALAQGMAACRLLALSPSAYPAVTQRLAAGANPQTLLLDVEGRVLGRLQGRSTPRRWGHDVADLLLIARHALPLLGKPLETLDPTALLWLGKLYWNRGERGRAVSCFERLQQCTPAGTPQPEEVAELLAQHHLEAGRYAESASLARSLLARASSDERRCRATLLVALSLKGVGQASQAVDVLLAAARELRRAPSHDELLFCLGSLQLELGAREEARRTFEACARIYPETMHGQRSLRRCRALQGE